MSKTWYPVISYENCTECGACFDKCSHEVYALKNASPVVVNPDGCVQGCHGESLTGVPESTEERSSIFNLSFLIVLPF